jgi:flagella basal body P-ring formation protein FlgA
MAGWACVAALAPAQAASEGPIVIPGPGERSAEAVVPSLRAAGDAPPRVETPVAVTRLALQQPVRATAATVPATATGLQDGEAIRQAALAFLQQQAQGLPGKVSITVNQAFARGLSACAVLAPFMPTGSRMWGRTMVGVRCAGERPWTLYLPARVSVQATYYTAARALMPGDVLSPADLVARDADLTTLPQTVITDPSQAVGSTTLTRVSEGMPLRRDMMRSASAVTVGQTVRIVALGPGFSITAQGSVMNNASPGQTVRVRTEAGQIIQGVVKDSGTVEIEL